MKLYMHVLHQGCAIIVTRFGAFYTEKMAIFSVFLHKNNYYGTHSKCLSEIHLLSTYKICIRENLQSPGNFSSYT